MNYCKGIVCVILVSAYIFCSAGCGNKKADISYGDVIIEKVQYSGQLEVEKPFAKIISDFSMVSSELKNLGFSDDTIGFYDKEYFMKKNIIVVVVRSGVSNEFSVEMIESTEKELKIVLAKEIPKNVEDLLDYKGILIEVDKDTVIQDAKVVVSINGD